MRHKLYHVGIRTDGPVDQNRLEEAFGQAGEWLRLNQFNWYVWTDNVTTLYTLVQAAIGPKASVVILPIDPDERWGFAPKVVWDWIDDKRERIHLEGRP